jgi:DNA-binding SARP family transcriptional activator
MIQLHRSGDGSGLSLRLLGGWWLTDSGTNLAASQAMQRLLALLAVRGPLQRSTLAAQLWPDSPDRQAAGSLRELLWRLRQQHPDSIELTRDQLQLDSSVRVDVIQLVVGVRTLEHSSLPTEDILPLLTSGDLLPAWHEDWVEIEREHLRQMQLHGLELLAEHRLAEHRHHEALQCALAAALREPLRESAHRTIVRAHLAMGNYSQAVAQYERYTEHLDDELGVRPSREFTDLLRDRTRITVEYHREVLPMQLAGHPRPVSVALAP